MGKMLARLVQRNKAFITSRRSMALYIDEQPSFNPFQAIRLVKAHALAAFDETISAVVHLNVDPKRGEQVVKGSCALPHGLGKKTTVAVFTGEENKEKAKLAGADILSSPALLKEITAGNITFDKIIATPDMVPQLKPLAKILGPKGLFPNEKMGNLVTAAKLENAIRNAKMGSVEFKVDPGRNVHAPIGKCTFVDKALIENLRAFIVAVSERKPPGVKGSYFKGAYLSSTMGPSWKIEISTIDPRNTKTYLLGDLTKL
eukprot:TRINITY_DN9701_c0_g1_i4.p2 TRINITY_DN9701_c0_g1~~TRINITY_DN9701_c0_g1_i4.p2  ORF type:complete len:259 (-),score=63.20 TRINITY_DN9701_c0_g1_i4:959-1735(-)